MYDEAIQCILSTVNKDFDLYENFKTEPTLLLKKVFDLQLIQPRGTKIFKL